VFSRYLQQLVMESIGQTLDRAGARWCTRAWPCTANQGLPPTQRLRANCVMESTIFFVHLHRVLDDPAEIKADRGDLAWRLSSMAFCREPVRRFSEGGASRSAQPCAASMPGALVPLLPCLSGRWPSMPNWSSNQRLTNQNLVVEAARRPATILESAKRNRSACLPMAKSAAWR